MRKIGAKDIKKRKVKTILNGCEERDLINDYENGVSTKTLLKKYNVTKGYVSNMFKRRGLGRRVDFSCVAKWERIKDPKDLEENISGVYAIYFTNKDYATNDIKLYIGSSSNISSRLQEHMRNLNNNNHYSKLLTAAFNNQQYSINYAIIERCDSSDMMQREGFYLSKWSKSCLLNTWRSTTKEELEPWLQEAINRDAYAKNYTINEITGCKESDYVHKSGYGAMQVTINSKNNVPGDTKYLYKHRVAYWEKHGEYPELVRHLCNNPKCYNADHLDKGTHRDNALDKRGDFPEEFESKWLEFGADLQKLNDYYGVKWNSNMKLGNSMVSRQIYQWEIKLNLREKYPDVIKANKNRRFNSLRGE